MIKQTVDYVDFNGQERKEDFYFHLSLPELTRIEAEVGSNLSEYIKELAGTQDVKTLLDFLERIILTSYGKKTTDGKSFLKSEDSRHEFEHSQAYAELFEKLLTDAKMAEEFGKGIGTQSKSQQKKNSVDPKVEQLPKK